MDGTHNNGSLEAVDDFRLLFEAAPVALLILRPDDAFTIVDASDAYLKVTLTRREEIAGKPLFEAFPDNPDIPDSSATANLHASLVTVVQTKTSHAMAMQRYDVLGADRESFEVRYWSSANFPVLHRDGSLRYIIHRVEDVTEQVTSMQNQHDMDRNSRLLQDRLGESERETSRSNKALEATRLSLQDAIKGAEAWRLGEARFRLITDALPQSVWTASPNGFLDYHNQRFTEFSGAPPEAAEDGLWVNFLHPDEVDQARARWKQSVASGAPYENTFRVRSRTGEYRWTLARALPVRDVDGHIVKWVGTNTDIHEKVLAEQELRDAHRRKDEFLAMLAHELRNPLVPIDAGAEMLAKVGGADERVTKISEMICRQVKHVTGLIDDLLEVSRVTQGRIALEQGTVDMKKVVHDSAEQTGPLLEARQHRLDIDLPDGEVCVRGDHSRLVQVLSNLLNNAAKYTPDHGFISLSVERVAEEVVVRVKDNGIGMEPGLLRRAFDLFQQGERAAARTEGGLGIGLALVKSLVEQHHGDVTAASAGLQQGSELTIRLPLVEGTPESRAPAGSEAIAPGRLHRRRILLVDDNVDVAESVGMVLEILGHDVAIEHNAQNAITRARAESFDRCILDIGLPGMNGYELSRALHALPGTEKAVFVAHTGYGQKEDRQLSAEAGFTHHLVKPAGIEELERVLADETAD